MMEVSVVIPNYNGIQFIKGCLDSLIALEDTVEYEIIVVDNCSDDGSRELVEKSYKDVKLISLDKNYGFCKAVNVGIQKAQAPFVILLNNDTKVLDGFVEGLYKCISGNEKLFSVSPMMIQAKKPELIDDAGDFYCALGWAYAKGKDKPVGRYEKSYPITAACGGASIYRKQIFEQIGYFDEAHFAYLEDIDVGYRARIYGYENYYEPKAKVYHEGSGASGSRYNEFKVTHSSRNSIYLIRKNMPWLQRIVNLPFFIVGFAIKTLFFYKKGLGAIYVKGLLQGMGQPLGEKKVLFQWKNLKNYLILQWELWINVFRRVSG